MKKNITQESEKAQYFELFMDYPKENRASLNRMIKVDNIPNNVEALFIEFSENCELLNEKAIQVAEDITLIKFADDNKYEFVRPRENQNYCVDFSNFKNLKVLEAPSFGYGWHVFPSLFPSESIEVLKISKHLVADLPEELSKCRNLKELHRISRYITPNGKDSLPNVLMHSSIEYLNTQISGDSIEILKDAEVVANMKYLNKLEIIAHNWWMEEYINTPNSNVSKITSLSISGIPNNLAQFKELKEIRFRTIPNRSHTIPILPSMKKVSVVTEKEHESQLNASINISCSEMDMQEIETLALVNCLLRDSAVKKLIGAPNLKKAWLENIELENQEQFIEFAAGIDTLYYSLNHYSKDFVSKLKTLNGTFIKEIPKGGFFKLQEDSLLQIRESFVKLGFQNYKYN